jgi:orotidine-5'-phosphate decarboxylase
MMFFNKLHDKIVSCKTRLCIGIDPLVPPESHLLKNGMGVSEIVEKSVDILIKQAIAHGVPAVKFQSAYFEALGTDGFAILHRAIAKTRSAHLLSILDAKRGDIASTMQAYGRFAFEFMNADCLTITPYMGIDTVEPLLPWLKADRGVYVVWATSNKSADSLQFLSTGGRRFFQNVHEVVNSFADKHAIGPAVGYVLGATKLGSPEIREALSSFSTSSFLLPGVGAQGGKVDSQLDQLLAKHPSSLVPISREIGEISVSIRSLAEYEEKVSDAVNRLKTLLSF